MSNTIPNPEAFFGFRLGSDRKIARWDKIVDYFNLLGDQSENIRVINMGPTTEGNPFLLAIISSAGNLERLDELKSVNAQIADPRGLSQARINRLIKKRSRMWCVRAWGCTPAKLPQPRCRPSWLTT